MSWADTSAGVMKMRNGANSAWISLYELDGTFLASDISLAAGSAAAPSLFFTGDTNTGLFSPGADTVALATAGSNRLHITSGGLVGIGTSSWSLNSVNTKFGVSLSGTTGDGIGLFSGQSSANAYVAVGSQYDVSNANNGSQIRFGIDSLGDTYSMLAFATANASTPVERVRIDRLGNVGIGTTSPGSNLHVSAASGTAIKISETNNGVSGSLQAGSTSVSLGTDTNHSLNFYTNAAERARIDSSGKLLVGTSNSGTSSATGQLRLGGTGSHSGSVLLSNASQGVANNGTVDITVGTASAIIYVGFLIVNSMNSISNSDRTQTTFSIFASPQNSSFTATQIATATGGGSRTFTVTSPSAGVIRVTNTSGGNSDIAMCFMGTGGFMT